MVKGKHVKTDEKCIFLMDNGLCSVFDDRFNANPDCLKIEEMIEQGTVPPWCLHVKDDPEYQARDDLRLYEFEIVPKEMPRKELCKTCAHWEAHDKIKKLSIVLSEIHQQRIDYTIDKMRAILNIKQKPKKMKEVI